MINFKNHIHDFFDIASKNDMPWDIGIDMFLANVRNSNDPKLPYYEGADKVDYKALKPELEKMSNEEIAKEYNEVVKYIRANLKKIGEERKARK